MKRVPLKGKTWVLGELLSPVSTQFPIWLDKFPPKEKKGVGKSWRQQFGISAFPLASFYQPETLSIGAIWGNSNVPGKHIDFPSRLIAIVLIRVYLLMKIFMPSFSSWLKMAEPRSLVGMGDSLPPVPVSHRCLDLGENRKGKRKAGGSVTSHHFWGRLRHNIMPP